MSASATVQVKNFKEKGGNDHGRKNEGSGYAGDWKDGI